MQSVILLQQWCLSCSMFSSMVKYLQQTQEINILKFYKMTEISSIYNYIAAINAPQFLFFFLLMDEATILVFLWILCIPICNQLNHLNYLTSWEKIMWISWNGTALVDKSATKLEGDTEWIFKEFQLHCYSGRRT